MLTIFAAPKAFSGHVGIIQRNAISSWLRVAPDLHILLFGDEPGTEETARELGVDHVPSISCNEYGTPLANDIFERAQQNAAYDLLCYANSDIILLGDLAKAAATVSRLGKPGVVVGQSVEMDLRTPVDFGDPGWSLHLKQKARVNGIPRGPFAMDYFLFTRGVFGAIPPFALGRARYDNWLIWRARQFKAAVIDATDSICAIHQRHDYSHLAGGRSEAYAGPEARRNQKLAGKRRYFHLYSTLDATHVLSPRGIRRRRPGLSLLHQFWLRFNSYLKHRHA